MQVVVEFFGQARQITDASEIELELKDGAAVYNMLQALASVYPVFLETVIDAANWSLKPCFILNLNGKTMIKDPDFALPAGSRLILMSAVVGG
ncbi:MAG: hypothetical protein CL394_01845 [Acidiferrobacteraceae bacterium]|nr:hypothetical protein [Acidiferrobacteraceae bacterium]